MNIVFQGGASQVGSQMLREVNQKKNRELATVFSKMEVVGDSVSSSSSISGKSPTAVSQDKHRRGRSGDSRYRQLL